MATFLIFAVLLFAHFVADFVLQPHWMALQKSQKLGVLAMHVSIHLATFFVFGLGVFGQMGPALLLSAINGGLHGLIDWNIWRGFKRYATKKAMGPEFSVKMLSDGSLNQKSYSPYDDHWFWTTIGLDQLLHGLSIVLALFITSQRGVIPLLLSYLGL